MRSPRQKVAIYDMLQKKLKNKILLTLNPAESGEHLTSWMEGAAWRARPRWGLRGTAGVTLSLPGVWGQCPKPQRHPRPPGRCKPQGIDRTPRSAGQNRITSPSPGTDGSTPSSPSPPDPQTTPTPSTASPRLGNLSAGSLKRGRRRKALKRQDSVTAANPAAGAGDAGRNAKHPPARAAPGRGKTPLCRGISNFQPPGALSGPQHLRIRGTFGL